MHFLCVLLHWQVHSRQVFCWCSRISTKEIVNYATMGKSSIIPCAFHLSPLCTRVAPSPKILGLYMPGFGAPAKGGATMYCHPGMLKDAAFAGDNCVQAFDAKGHCHQAGWFGLLSGIDTEIHVSKIPGFARWLCVLCETIPSHPIDCLGNIPQYQCMFMVIRLTMCSHVSVSQVTMDGHRHALPRMEVAVAIPAPHAPALVTYLIPASVPTLAPSNTPSSIASLCTTPALLQTHTLPAGSVPRLIRGTSFNAHTLTSFKGECLLLSGYRTEEKPI